MDCTGVQDVAAEVVTGQKKVEVIGTPPGEKDSFQNGMIKNDTAAKG